MLKIKLRPAKYNIQMLSSDILFFINWLLTLPLIFYKILKNWVLSDADIRECACRFLSTVEAKFIIFSRNRRMFKMSKLFTSYLLILLMVFIFCFPAAAGISTVSASPKEITVVSDDNYPPYIFRDENSRLQGILVDEWRLWEEKTGIKVDLRGMDWDKAQKMMAEENAQVIDTIFLTEERAKKLAFTAP